MVAVSFLAPSPAWADYASAKRAFNELSVDDKIKVTLGLISTGDYVGLLDYGFTRHYYKSVLAFEKREGLAADGVLSGFEMKKLDEVANSFYAKLGIRFIEHPSSKSLLLVPTGVFDKREDTIHGYAYERNDQSLSLSFNYYPFSERSYEDLYQSYATNSPRRKVAYERNRQGYFVSNGRFDGRNYYAWMSRIGSGTSGFTLSWTDGAEDMGSRISILLANTFVAVPRAGSEPSPSQPAPYSAPAAEANPVPEEKRSSGSGTGFVVSAAGHIVTNYHVAGMCRELWVKKAASPRIAASLVGSDKANDLALLQAQLGASQTVAKFRGYPAPKAGEEIVLFGFPRPDILSETGNVVSGNITSLAGIANDSREYQISAPVQPGNSGGPVLDRLGGVVGVVVARLNEEQNVNFSIKSSIVQTFLESFGISAGSNSATAVRDTAAVADEARDFTYRIECLN